ncbi:MAG TPA: mycofactocin-associated electron transfer flavoprotein alpha subunit [Acidimicrobiales bacterium]|nr:mycofactocin-associated electron transfer flavoprotein alpha subunit [Acidimicrobiales bacterium]
MTATVAVIVVRDGMLPAGADECVAEAHGRALLCGSGTEAAAKQLVAAVEVRCAELGSFAPGAWARALVDQLADARVVILPASADGRDLAPRLALALGRRLFAGAVAVDGHHAVLVRGGGLLSETHSVDASIVATLEPGVRGVEPVMSPAMIERVELTVDPGHDPEIIELVPPDPATVDLGEASRIAAGGAGLGGPEPFAVLQHVAIALGASYGASRVAADAGWVPQDRFIGTTGVAVDPELYIAFGISGAVQHVSGLGQPDHIIAVNTDASAPMMAMADLAIETDARAMLDELARRLDVQQ